MSKQQNPEVIAIINKMEEILEIFRTHKEDNQSLDNLHEQLEILINKYHELTRKQDDLS